MVVQLLGGQLTTIGNSIMTIGDYITTIGYNITTIWQQRGDKKVGEKWGTVQFLVYRQHMSLHPTLINRVAASMLGT